MAGHSEGKGILGNHYVRIYVVLLVLLLVSILGPEVGERLDQQVTVFGVQFGLGITLTLITAFGIAVVKAWLVIKNFMHLTVERVMPKLFLTASVVLLALFWGGVAPDVQLDEGRLWVNDAARAAVARGLAEPEDHAEEDDHAVAVAVGAEAAEADDHGAVAAGSAAYAGLVPSSKSTDNLLPGGYNLVHAAFWTVLILVAVGTNAVAIILSIGILVLKWETLSRIPIVRAVLGPIVRRVARLPGVSRVQRFLFEA